MKIAIVDSGINAADPHVRSITGGIGATSLEGWTEDISDRLGHGTAVAAVIREKVPEADLYAVKVFDHGLSIRAGAVVRALHWCRHYHMDLVSLSAGLDEVGWDSALENAVDGLLVVSPAGHLPGWLPGVIAVEADEACPRDEFRYYDGVFHASPCPPPAAGFRYKGVDIAVANMTGFVARALPSIPREGQSIAATRDRLMWELASLREARRV
jgi:subtilisin family serine protease